MKSMTLTQNHKGKICQGDLSFMLRVFYYYLGMSMFKNVFNVLEFEIILLLHYHLFIFGIGISNSYNVHYILINRQ